MVKTIGRYRDIKKSLPKFADFTVLDRDILKISPREILDTRVTFTVVEGEVVYSGR